MPWSFIIPAAASLIGGSMAAKSAREAASSEAAMQQKALEQQDKALQLQQRMYEEGVARQQPFLAGGTEDYNRLRAMMMGGPGAAQQFLQMDPGYGFRLSEGTKALERSAAARGGLLSGNTGRALQRYGQDLASQEFGNAYGRLAGLAQIGPSAAGVMNTLGQQYATGAGNAYGNMGNIYGAMGQSAGGAQLARGSIYQNMLGDIGRLYGRTQPSFGGMFGGGSAGGQGQGYFDPGVYGMPGGPG